MPRPISLMTFEREFRLYEDDAWYVCSTTIQIPSEVLFVFLLSSGRELKFHFSDFKDEAAVNEFEERFRAASVKPQHGFCKEESLVGMTVCAAHVSPDGALKFYDAELQKVVHKEHSLSEKGEEMCLCQFDLCWKHGPNKGSIKSSSIEDIRLLYRRRIRQSFSLHSFLRRTKLRMIKGTVLGPLFPEWKEEPDCLKCQLANTSTGVSNVEKKLAQDRDPESECHFAKRLKENGEWFYIVIENIEVDLSAASIVDFVHQQTSIRCYAQICPNSSSAAYTRGTIFLESNEDLEKLYGFLVNPSYFIISSKGRPWIIIGKGRKSGGFEGLAQLSERSSDKTESAAEKLKVARQGTTEYEKGKILAFVFQQMLVTLDRLS